MAGEAKTTEFLLSTATVMVGPAADVFGLTPDKHSIGLVKNVQAGADPKFVELTQGINAQVVMSVNTELQTRISAEVYEYTARNFAYAAQLDGSDTSFDPLTVVSTLSADAATGTTLNLSAGDGADWEAGDYGAMQDGDSPDKVHIFKVASVAVDAVTLDEGFAIPATVTYSKLTTKIYKVRNIKVGAVPEQPVFGVKMVGLLPGSGQPVTLIFPKVKITKGLNLAFQTNDFANMPFEFTPYALVAADPFYAEFGSTKTWSLLRS